MIKSTKINMKTTSINSKFSAVAAGVNSPWADGADSLGGNSIRSQGRDGENFKFQKRILTKILNNILKT